VIAAPVLEEVLYRGLLQDAIRRATGRPWISITVTSLVFMMMHASIADWHALPPLFVLSLGLGWAYERTGRLATPIIMHAGFNLANLAVAMSQA
jgi:membrane protease YdiL (CAAX protease family)